MSAPYKVADGSVVIDILDGTGLFQEPAAVLDGLTDDEAHAKPHGLPHSIADIVAHMCYWQEWFNECARSGFTTIAQHAAEGWPEVPDGSWEAVRERYIQSLAEAKHVATEFDALERPLLPPGVELPVLARESVGSGLLQAAVHGAHHLGQIITIRQVLGLWPPPSGGLTW